MNPEVVTIILNYNRPDDTIECINSLKQISYNNNKILIIDNCSTDNSYEILKSTFPGIPAYKTDKNLGYTGGINFGFCKAMDEKPKYILVLNNDTVVTGNFLTELVNAMESSPSAAGAGGLIVAEHDRSTIWFAGGKIIPWRGLAIHYNKGMDSRNYKNTDIEKVGFLTGCMILFRTEILSVTGTEDERFFLYLDDIEFSSRIIKEGFDLLYVPKSVIYHKVLGENESIHLVYYTVRNRLLLIRLMNHGIVKIIAYIYFLMVISIKLGRWFFTNRPFYHSAIQGLKDYFNNVFNEGNGITRYYK